MKEPIIIIMAKRPQVGNNKTRLMPLFSPEDASALYEAMLLDTLALVESLPGIRPAVAVTPAADADYFHERVGPDTLVYPVDGPDIGACLDSVLTRGLAEGYFPALAINSDGPGLPPEVLGQAWSLFLQAEEPPDVVLGPNLDGGYYLVGLAAPRPGLFENVTWSTPDVWQATLRNAAAVGLRVEALPEFYDVDTAEDVALLRQDVEDAGLERLVHTRRFFEERK